MPLSDERKTPHEVPAKIFLPPMARELTTIPESPNVFIGDQARIQGKHMPGSGCPTNAFGHDISFIFCAVIRKEEMSF
jgi:hypothetical protein